MGTYLFKPYTVFTKSALPFAWSASPGGATDDAALIAAVGAVGGTQIVVNGVNYTDAFIVFVGAMYLDGSAIPILTPGGMPAGFIITTCDLLANMSSNLLTATNSISVEFDQLESFALNGVAGPNYIFPHPGAVPSVAHLFSDNLGYRITHPGDVGNFNAGCSYLVASGDYGLFAFTYTIDPPHGSDVDAGENGTLVTITSDINDPVHLLLNHLTISTDCGVITIVIQTETLFQFYLPIACSGNGLTSILATGDGVQFSGSVSLASLDILLTNASGIYTLVRNKTNDTLYSSLRDGTTRNVKIPNPFIKTGYIGG